MSSFESLSIVKLKHVLNVKLDTFDKEKKAYLNKKQSECTEKNELIALLKEHVEEGEIEKLLAKPDPLSNKSKKKEANAQKDAEKQDKLNRLRAKQRSGGGSHGNFPPVPSPDQMRQNAAMIRKNPSLAKKGNPQLAKMSNEELMQLADQMEKMAEDPDMYKQVTEQVNSMTPQERAEVAKMQKEGTLPKTPVGGTPDAMSQEHQIATMAKMVKSNPGLLKKMMKQQGGMFANQSDEQIDSYIKQLSVMDEQQLKQIFSTGTYLQQYAGPAKEWYEKLDKATYGCAKYILGALALIVGYYLLIFLWYILKNVFFALRYVFYLVTGAGASSSKVAGDAADIAKTAVSETTKTVKDIPGATGDEFEF